MDEHAPRKAKPGEETHAHTTCPRCLHAFIEHDYCHHCGPIRDDRVLPFDRPAQEPPKMTEEEARHIAQGHFVEDYGDGPEGTSPARLLWFTLALIVMAAFFVIGLWIYSAAK